MKKFKCPACGSEKFGTVHANGLVYGTCHGVFDPKKAPPFTNIRSHGVEWPEWGWPRLCPFTWDRDDDGKVFVETKEKP